MKAKRETPTQRLERAEYEIARLQREMQTWQMACLRLADGNRGVECGKTTVNGKEYRWTVQLGFQCTILEWHGPHLRAAYDIMRWNPEHCIPAIYAKAEAERMWDAWIDERHATTGKAV